MLPVSVSILGDTVLPTSVSGIGDTVRPSAVSTQSAGKPLDPQDRDGVSLTLHCRLCSTAAGTPGASDVGAATAGGKNAPELASRTSTTGSRHPRQSILAVPAWPYTRWKA